MPPQGLPRSYDLGSFAQFSNLDEAVHEFVTALRPLAGKYAAGDPVSSFSYPDIQRVYDGASHIIIGQLASRPHPILSRILPAKISDKIQHSVTTTELLYTLPVANPHGGTNQSMSEKETVEWFHSRRYGIHFWLEGDYLNTPEGAFKLTQQMGRQVAYLNERGITEGYKALLRKPPHQEQEESGNSSNELGTKNVRAMNRDDFFTELERRNAQTALFHKDPIGIHKAFEYATNKIQEYTQQGASPDCCIMPSLHAQILKNASEYRYNYSKGGQEAVDRLNKNAFITDFMGMDIFYAPHMMIDNRKMRHPARNEKVHGEYGFIDTLLYKQIDMYDVSIDQDKRYTIRDCVNILNETWCDATLPMNAPRPGIGGAAGADGQAQAGGAGRRIVAGNLEAAPGAAAAAAGGAAAQPLVGNEEEEEVPARARPAAMGRQAGLGALPGRGFMRRGAAGAPRVAGLDSNVTYNVVDADGDVLQGPLAALGHLRRDYIKSFEKQIFQGAQILPGSRVTLELHGFLFIQAMYSQYYMSIPFQKSACGSVYFTRIHRTAAEDAVHQTDVYNATQYIGVAMTQQKHRWVLDDLVYAGIGPGASKEVVTDLAKYKHGPPTQKDDEAMFLLPIFRVRDAFIRNANGVEVGVDTKHLAQNPRKYFTDKSYFDVRGRFDCDDPKKPSNYLLSDAFLNTTGIGSHIKSKKAANVMFRCTQKLHGLPATNRNPYSTPDAFIPSAGPHGTHEQHGDAPVRAEGKSLYREAAAQLVKEV